MEIRCIKQGKDITKNVIHYQKYPQRGEYYFFVYFFHFYWYCIILMLYRYEVFSSIGGSICLTIIEDCLQNAGKRF